MKIKYTYTAYKGLPKTTEVSRKRELGAITNASLPTVLFIAFLCGSFFTEGWDCVGCIVVCVLCLAYLIYFVLFYDKTTKKKIAKAMKKELEEQREFSRYLEDSKYGNKYIHILQETKKGNCLKCGYKSEELTLCDIKNDVGRRKMFICKECMRRYQFQSKSRE